MRILMLSYRIPFPLTAGFRIRIFNSAKYLKKSGHTIDLMFLGKHSELEKYNDELRTVFDEMWCFEVEPLEVVWNLFTKTLLRKKPLQVALYWNKKMNRCILKNQDKYDLILGNSVRNAEYLLEIPSNKAYLDLHDAASYNYKNLIPKLHFPKKLLYIVEYNLLKKYECWISSRIQNICIISNADREYLKRNGAETSNMQVMPVAGRDDIRNLKTSVYNDEISVCFLGKMSYQPNEDAAVWFAKEVFPVIKEKYKEFRFYIIGIEPTRKVIELSERSGVIVTGFLENPYEIVEKCVAMIVPIRNGAGMQNKILESMVVGTPCIISSIAEEGLNGINWQTYIVDNSKNEDIEGIERIIGDYELRKKISDEGKKFVSQYKWPNIEKKLCDFLKLNDIEGRDI